MKKTPNPYNLIVEIEEGKKEELLNLLAKISGNLYENDIFPIAKIESIHFGRLVVLHKYEGRVEYPDQLVLSTNYDGDLDTHLNEIIRCPQAKIDKLFSCCKGYNTAGSENEKLEWFKRNAQLKAYFYRGTWGQKKEQIDNEEYFRQKSENKIDSLEDQNLEASELRDFIIEDAEQDPEFKPYKTFTPPKLHLLPKILFLLATVVLLGCLISWNFVLTLGLIFIGILLLFIVILRMYEVRDVKKQYNKVYSDQEKTQVLAEQEDKIVQNQLTHLVEIKPGWFRLFTLKLVLTAIAYLAETVFNKGKLGGIPTIHYARWIIIDKGKRLLFFSNFDGSWESYLGDFVDKAAVGLTGVWSNTVHFPATRFLILEGARDEQRFKSWARSKQITTNVWYSAYPNLTVTNIANNRQIHHGLTNKLDKSETKEWLLRY